MTPEALDAMLGEVGTEGQLSKADLEKLFEKLELKNGRRAMLAFSGMIHQTFVTGKPLFASLGDIFS